MSIAGKKKRVELVIRIEIQNKCIKKMGFLNQYCIALGGFLLNKQFVIVQYSEIMGGKIKGWAYCEAHFFTIQGPE